MTTLIGGVSELYQGDLDFGRLVVERLADEALGPDVVVDDLHYGAIAVAQRLEDVAPDLLVLVGAVARGRPPGTVERRVTTSHAVDATAAAAAVADAATGYVGLDLVVEVAAGLGALPPRVVAVEVEPAGRLAGAELSPAATAALDIALDLIRAEVRRAPLLRLAAELRTMIGAGGLDPSPALESLVALLAELRHLEEEGRWGAAFAERDRLRLRIGLGETSEGMSHLDWGLWWALVEELDRLQGVEARSA